MDRAQFVNQKIDRLIQFWAGLAAFFGSLFFIVLSVMDYIATPENFSRFLKYRVLGALILAVMSILTRKSVNRKYQLFLLYFGVITSTSIIEYMILQFGGHSSPYYAGIFILVMVIVGFIPMDLIHSVRISVIAFSIYVVPIAFFDKSINLNIFAMPISFLFATFLIANVWRYLSQKSLVNELSLQYELNQEKKKLEMHSAQLEELIKERTKELSISEKWHRSVFDNATDGIMVLDKTGKIVNVNQKACEIHGFDKSALIGVNAAILETKGNDEGYEERMSNILSGESLIYEAEHYRKDGNKVILEVSSKAIDIGGETFIQSFYRDITEKKRIQEQLMQSQKMESVGSLAGGIAHNFNNILTAILGYSELLLEFSDLDDPSRQRVRRIESAARKAGVMVSKLLSFARRESHELLPLNFNDVVNDSAKLFEGILDKRIGLKVTVSDGLPIIEGDPNQLEQAIMNLVVNARDAMPDGGLITIETNFIEVTQGRGSIPAYVGPGKYVVLTVTDTGHGISPDIIGRIFDPFFTTKEKGKGTGLGLATVYGIVKDHKGHISVRSEVGKGTCFTLYLPASAKTVLKALKPKIVSVEGTEKILLIDDDREVLNLITDILETHGYQIIPVNNSLTAIDIFRNNTEKIQLVITDMVMPLMEGAELIALFRSIKPGIKIIVISGYGYESAHKANLMNAFLKKPFERIELLSTVRRVLDTEIRNLPLN